MNKKFKWAVPFAVLAISCGVSAGVLTGCDGCNDEEHVHSYEWKHNEKEHWKECPEDGTVDESTRGEHLFIANECDCGATKTPEEEAKYGTASGQVKLRKFNAFVTDYSGLTVDVGDDDVDCTVNKDTGAFKIENAKVGKDYTLTISKKGYKSYSTTLSVEENKNVIVGGSRGITLEYEVFTTLVGYDDHLHDYSHVNDANPTIGVNGDGGKSLDVISADSYEDVSVSIKTKASNGGNIQGIVLKFADGTYAIFNVHIGQKDTQFRPELWGMKSVWGVKKDEGDGDNWIEDKGVVTAEDIAKFNGDGLEVTLVRKGGKLYYFLDGRKINEIDLPEDRAEDQIQVGLFSFDVKANAVWSYEIIDDAAMETEFNVNVSQPDGVTGCAVAISPEKDKYVYGDKVELSFNAPDGYILNAITVNGEDVYGSIVDGKLALVATRNLINVDATFVAEQRIALDITVKGNKLGTNAGLAEGTKVKFKGTKYEFTVGADGKITADEVIKGRYTVTAEGYLDKEILLDEDLEEIVLEFDTFTTDSATSVDFSKMNDGVVKATGLGGAYFTTNESYTDVNVEAKFDFIGDYATTQRRYSVALIFADNKNLRVDLDLHDNNQYVMQETNWDSMMGFGWGNAKSYTVEQVAAFAANGVNYKLIRNSDKVAVYLNGEMIKIYTLPEAYADKAAQVRFIYDCNGTDGTKKITYTISDTVPSFTVTDGTAQGSHGTVTGIPEEGVKLGSKVTLIVTAQEDYKLTALNVNGTNVLNKMNGNQYSFEIGENTTIEAVFEAIVYSSVNIEVSGKKFGVTGNSLAADTKVKLTCNGFADITTTLTEGAEGKLMLAVPRIAAEKWTVKIDGYVSTEITVTEEEYTAALTLEYKTFNVVRWDTEGHDLSKVNEAQPSIKWQGPGASLNVVSADCDYDDITVSVTLKKSFTTNGEGQQGLIIRFENGKAAILNINISGTPRLQFRPELFSDNNDASVGLRTAFDKEWVEFKTVTQAEVEKYKSETGIELKVVRKGASLFIFLDDRFIGIAELAESYAQSKAGYGFFSYDGVVGAEWKYTVSAQLPDMSVTVTDETTDEHGSIAITPTTGLNLGDTVTITVTPSTDGNYILDSLTVSGGITPTYIGNRQYTFVATESNHNVSATFKIAPMVDNISLNVAGIGINNSTIDMNGKTVVFTRADGETTSFEVAENKITGSLFAVGYTVSIQGFYDLTVTVREDGTLADDASLTFEKTIFATNIINEPTKNIFGEGNPVSWSADNTNAASEGVIKAVKDGKMYEWSTEEYKDVAITVTLKSGNGNQGLLMRFNGEQKDVRLRFENTKAQWIGGGWWWGTHHINDRWDFGDGEEFAKPMSSALLEKYNGNGLTLTLARKGGMVYAIIDGKVYSAQSVTGYADKNVRLAIFVENAKNGYNVPFKIENADDVLARAVVEAGTDLTAYLGLWTNADGTLKVEGKRGYAEFNGSAVKESATIHFAKDNAGDQGLVYRFSDGKYIGVRYQENGGNYKIQYTMDTVLYNDGSLKGWQDFMLADFGINKTTFEEDGANLTFIRDGKYFLTFLNNKLVDKTELDGKYAEMTGVMGVMIWNSKGVAFAYEHKTGNDVVIPINVVEVSFNGNAHGYTATLSDRYVKDGDGVTLTVKTANIGNAWGFIPVSIKIGDTEYITQAVKKSVSAGVCEFTLTIANVSADMQIIVTVDETEKVNCSFTVNNDEYGSIECDMADDATYPNTYYWNDNCTVEITAKDGYTLTKITIGEGDDAEIITDGWKANGNVYIYSFTVTGDIKVVAEFAAIQKSSLNAEISGNKLTVEGNALKVGDTVTFTSAEYGKIEALVETEEEKLVVKVSEIPVGTWTVGAAGYIDTQIIITDEAYLTPINLEYNLLKNVVKDWNWGDGGDVSKQNEGIYKHTAGATLWYATNDTYNAVSITVNVKTDITGRQGAMIKFGNDYVMIQLEKINDSEYKISWNADTGYGGWNTGVNNITGAWTECGERLSAETAASGNTNVTLTRIGNVIYASVNGVYCNKLTIDEKYSDMKCQVGIYGTNAQEGAVRNFNIVENAVSPETDE